MIPARTILSRAVVALVAPAVVAAAIVVVAGSTSVVACNPCDDDIKATIVIVPTPPPDSCLNVQLSTPTLCSFGGEVLEVNNGCASPLRLTSPFFVSAGSPGVEGGTGNTTFNIPAHSLATLVAGPNAVGASVLSLEGTYDDTPIEITIYLQQVTDTGVDASASQRDASSDTGFANDAAADVAKGHLDSGAKDAGSKVDSGHGDAGHGDAGHGDAESADTGLGDVAVTDAATKD